MADNYLGKKMEDHMRALAPKRATTRSLMRLLEKNRSHRSFDSSFKVREDQLRRIIEVATKIAKDYDITIIPGIEITRKPDGVYTHLNALFTKDNNTIYDPDPAQSIRNAKKRQLG